MGRATYDSIGRPLPGRTTIVVTRNPDWSADGVLVAHSLDDALALAADQPGRPSWSGGTQIYEQALPLATHQVLTEVHLAPEGDALLPRVRPRRVGRDPARAARRVRPGSGGSGDDARPRPSTAPATSRRTSRSVAQIAAQVAAGELPPGTKLPTRPRAGRDARASRPTPWPAPTASWSTPAWSRPAAATARSSTATAPTGPPRRRRRAYADAMRALGVRQDEALELVRRAFDRPVSS